MSRSYHLINPTLLGVTIALLALLAFFFDFVIFLSFFILEKHLAKPPQPEPVEKS